MVPKERAPLTAIQTWFAIAHITAQRSHCSRSQTGAVIVSKDNRILATGYNGPPAKYECEGMCINWCQRAMNDGVDAPSGYLTCPAVHAEANALLYAARSTIEGGSIYVTRVPCMDCSRLISNSGLERVYLIDGDPADQFRPTEDAIRFMKDSAIKIHRFPYAIPPELSIV